MNANGDLQRFSIRDNILMTNSILQISSVNIVSAALLLSTNNNFVWGFSLISLFTSLLVIIFSEASYETDCITHGNFFETIKLYNDLAKISCTSLLFALISFMFNTIFDSYFRAFCVAFCVGIGFGYISRFYVYQHM